MDIPTPDLSHLTREDYEHVYEPAEDTFILLDALEQDQVELRNFQPRICLEIGSGSGCVSSFLGSILGSSSALYLTTDINPRASLCTLRTGHQNKISLQPLNASFAQPLFPRIHRAVDLLVFNPPYVPTYNTESVEGQGTRDIQGAYAGGKDGMQVTDILLDQVHDLLSPQGRFYLVAVRQNDVPGICRRMLDKYGLRSQVVLQRRTGREHLCVVRFSR